MREYRLLYLPLSLFSVNVVLLGTLVNVVVAGTTVQLGVVGYGANHHGRYGHDEKPQGHAGADEFPQVGQWPQLVHGF